MRPDCIGVMRQQCQSLARSYQERQEELLSQMLDAADEHLICLAAKLAAYDLAMCSVERLNDIIVDCYYERSSEEQTLRMTLDGFTREMLLLGGAKEQADGRDFYVGKPSASLQHYHQAQAEALGDVLHDIEIMLSPVLTNYVTSFMEQEQIQTLDAQPYWSNTTRRKAVAEVCQKLADEGKLDATYAMIAQELVKIEYPRDIHSQEDGYQRDALPTYVRRLLVRDLLAFIASLKVESFAEKDARRIAMIGCTGSAQRLVERRATEIPVPELSMWMQIAPSDMRLFDQIGLTAVHPEPCLFCSTHDGHCDYWQVTFPDGTNFGEATQTDYDQLLHSYSFSPVLPGKLPDGLCVYLGYNGIWEPDRPWTLAVLDLSEELAEKREG